LVSIQIGCFTPHIWLMIGCILLNWLMNLFCL